MKLRILLLSVVTCCTTVYSQSIDTNISKNLSDFYGMYINKLKNAEGYEFTPQVEKSPKGFAYLNMEKYSAALRNSGYFTENFIKSEISRTQGCAKKISKIKYEKYEKIEMGGHPKECNFFYYDHWFKAQDYPNGVIIKSTTVKDNTHADVKFSFDVGNGTEVVEWDIKGSAEMVLEGGSWKINSLVTE